MSNKERHSGERVEGLLGVCRSRRKHAFTACMSGVDRSELAMMGVDSVANGAHCLCTGRSISESGEIGIELQHVLGAAGVEQIGTSQPSLAGMPACPCSGSRVWK